jgi:hypothetical protein
MPSIIANKIQHKFFLQHETKRSVLLKFLLVLLIFLSYFIFIATKYGLQQGFFVSLLSWSFFVLCTPVADAGFLLDFPIRLITHIKMTVSELFVWTVAISLNLYAFLFQPEIYSKTKLLSFFKHILEQPIPFWSIIILSATGTFLSIKFGDELLDKAHHHERKKYHKHKNKFRLIFMFFLFLITFILYDFLLKKLGINLSF